MKTTDVDNAVGIIDEDDDATTGLGEAQRAAAAAFSHAANTCATNPVMRHMLDQLVATHGPGVVRVRLGESAAAFLASRGLEGDRPPPARFHDRAWCVAHGLADIVGPPDDGPPLLLVLDAPDGTRVFGPVSGDASIVAYDPAVADDDDDDDDVEPEETPLGEAEVRACLGLALRARLSDERATVWAVDALLGDAVDEITLDTPVSVAEPDFRIAFSGSPACDLLARTEPGSSFLLWIRCRRAADGPHRHEHFLITRGQDRGQAPGPPRGQAPGPPRGQAPGPPRGQAPGPP